MKFERLEIPDLILFEPKIFGDDRGFFYESYRKNMFSEKGICEDFVQDNHVQSSKGVLRGLHYQIEPAAQAKLVRVIRGKIFDVAVDIRKNSATFGKYVGVTLSADNHQMFYVPKGFAHGYCALEDGSEVLYKVSANYSPDHERGLAWDDPSIGIKWPAVEGGYVLSEKDKVNPTLEDAAIFS